MGKHHLVKSHGSTRIEFICKSSEVKLYASVYSEKSSIPEGPFLFTNQDPGISFVTISRRILCGDCQVERQ